MLRVQVADFVKPGTNAISSLAAPFKDTLTLLLYGGDYDETWIYFVYGRYARCIHSTQSPE
jgi:hypothetical protein